MELYKRAWQLIGFVQQSFKNYPRSIQAFIKLRDAASEDQDLATKLYAYLQIAKCFQYEREYRKAIICCKKAL